MASLLALPYLPEAALSDGPKDLEVVEVHCRKNRDIPGELAERPRALHQPPLEPLSRGCPPPLQGALPCTPEVGPGAGRRLSSGLCVKKGRPEPRLRGGSWGLCHPSSRAPCEARPPRTQTTQRTGCALQSQAPRYPHPELPPRRKPGACLPPSR